MSILEQVGAVLRSRKFWILVTAVVGIVASFSTGGITQWQAIQAFVASLAAYSLGIAIEDSGK